MKRAAEAVVIDAEMARCMVNISGRPSWWLWSVVCGRSVGFGFSDFRISDSLQFRTPAR
jgi:hypothetical protein